MKKLFTMMVLLGIFSAGASANVGDSNVNYLDQILATKSHSVVLSDIKKDQNKSANSNQCVSSCMNKFRACISTAQGTGAWWYCELTFEKCMTKCGI